MKVPPMASACKAHQPGRRNSHVVRSTGFRCFPANMFTPPFIMFPAMFPSTVEPLPPHEPLFNPAFPAAN